MNNVVLMFPRPMRERIVRSYGSVGSRAFPGMDQAWKSMNGFIVSFSCSFDQLKIYFDAEIKKKIENVILENCQSP